VAAVAPPKGGEPATAFSVERPQMLWKPQNPEHVSPVLKSIDMDSLSYPVRFQSEIAESSHKRRNKEELKALLAIGA